MPEAIRSIEWLALGSNVFNAMIPFYVNIDKTPEYLANTTGVPTTEDFYWTNRLVAALADAHFKEANLNGANLNRVNFLKWAHFEGADLFGAQLTESDCKQLPSSISQTQRYDLIVLSLVESPSVQVYQLTATKKIRNRRGDGIEHKIFGCQLNEQKTKELNQANWDIEIKELPSDNT